MDVLFWSGGKDSYLALEFFREKHDENKLKLLTTYNEDTDVVPHQNIDVSDIKKQAATLKLELILVPLPQECPNEEYLQRVEEALAGQQETVRRLIFGDWHLQDIREWREKAFGNMGYECLFPIWEKSIHDLLAVLMLKPVKITITAVQDKFQKFIRVGEEYNQRLVQQLPDKINPMGENGEFHTRVTIRSFGEIEPKKQPLI